MPTTHMMSRKADTIPNFGSWCSWINKDGDTTDDDIDIDNDGSVPTARIKVDIAQALSQRLGKQLSSMGTYRVNYISIRLVNKDDINDNDMGANFGGRIRYYSPNNHRIAAMKLGRTLEKNYESVQLDGDSVLLGTEDDYLGMRWNWDGDNQVGHPTSEAFSATPSGHFGGNQWNLEDLFAIYELSVTGPPTKTNSLWNGRCGYPSQLAWSATYNNQEESGFGTNDFRIELGNNPIEVLAGLLIIDVEDCSTDTSQVVDDDYQVMVTVGVTGWSDF